ncbi:MAG TPA: hypothetical protein VF131_11630 [Blastocatellia bacterium]|nr:hypothetical protein [Blastocatellia bacterium]
MSDFAPARLTFIAVLIGVLSLAAVPHTAMVSPQPFVVSTPNYFRAEYTKQTLQDSAPVESDKPHIMAASYYSLQGNLKSSISLNNKGLLPLEVKTTLFNMDGEHLDVPAVTIEATSFRVFDLAEWASLGGPSFQQGSLQLFYRGKDLLLGAQVKITDSASSIIFDEQLSEPKTMISSRLEGLWWLPSHDSQVSVAISNTTDSTQVVALEVGGIAPNQRASRELTLKPHQTLLIDPKRDFSDKPTALLNASGISIKHSGQPGDLIARAMIQDASAGFSSALQLADPKKAKSSSFHGAGLRLGEIAGEELTPVIVARNISNKSAVLRGRIPYTRSDGSIDVLALREINLRPGEVKQWELREARGLKGSAGLEFDYDTEPGSIIVSALSVSRSKNHVFQVPMLDVTVQKSSTGVYPFYFYASSSSIVYIKNTTTVEQSYVAHLNYEGGNYMMGVKTITPGETVTIDIRALRDDQVPDQEQRTIPQEITHGQVRWTIVQSEGTDLLALIGRSEQVDEVKAISSTYACQNCCGDFPDSVFISPSQVNMQVGQSITMSAFEQRVDCYGFAYLLPVSASWSSNNNSVATVSGGQVTSQGAGQATITASWNSFTSVATQCGPGFGPPPIEPTSCCRSTSFFRSATASITVSTTTVRIKMGGTDITNTTRDVIVGQKISLVAELQPAGQPISNQQWTVPGLRIANYIVNFTNDSSPTSATVTQLTNLTSSSVDFYWVDGGEGRQVQYSVSVNGQPFTARATFNVKRPTATLTTTSGANVAVNSACGPLELHYGCGIPPGPAGITFTSSVTVPSGFSGTAEYVQRVNSTTRTRLKTNGVRLTLQGTGLLDTDFPYGLNYDSPGQGFAFDDLQVTANDSFTMWVMFKPSTANSIWVPLKKVSWSWSGDALRSGTLNSGNHSGNQTGVNSTDHPQWTANVTSLTFR